jgi:CheY-like chemotaxis protein
LGLSIARQLVEAMGGRIGFNSQVGVGTTFHLELPVVEEVAQAPTPQALPPLSRSIPRVLHVEDDIDLSRVIEAALAGRAEVISAPTLHSAEEYLRNSDFSLVVLDAALPDGNGLDLLDHLPQLTHQRVPIVILSVTEVPQNVRQRVAAVLVKSRHSEAEIAQTILSLTRPRAA